MKKQRTGDESLEESLAVLVIDATNVVLHGGLERGLSVAEAVCVWDVDAGA